MSPFLTSEVSERPGSVPKSPLTRPQNGLLLASKVILQDALLDGYWDSGISEPITQILDQAMGVYGTSPVLAENIDSQTADT